MLAEILRHTVRFVLLLFIQVFVLNKLEIGGALNSYFNPYLYILFLLMLPVNLNKLLLLFLSFLTGLTVDLFSNTPGMHASACLVLAFLRPGLLNMIAPREGYEVTLRLNMQSMGISTFLVYAGILTLAHHLVLYFIEAFNFIQFFDLLLRVITNSTATFLLIILSQVLNRQSREVKA